MDRFIQHQLNAGNHAVEIGRSFQIPVRETLLDGFDAVLLHTLQREFCLRDIVALVCIDTETYIRSDRLTNQRQCAEILLRIDTGLDLQDAVAHILHIVCSAGRHLLRCADPDGDIVLNGILISAEYTVQWLAHHLSLDIVECDIDRALRRTVSMHETIHHHVRLFDVHRIHTDQSLTEHLKHRVTALHRFTGDRCKRRCFAITLDAFIGCDLDEQAVRMADLCKRDLKRLGQLDMEFLDFQICDFHFLPLPNFTISDILR